MSNRLCHIPWPPGTRLRHLILGEIVEVVEVAHTLRDLRYAMRWEGGSYRTRAGDVEREYGLVGDWPRPWLRGESERGEE